MAKAQKRAARANKKYSPEFIEKALIAWDKGRAEGKSAPEIATKIGCHQSSMWHWAAKRDGRTWASREKAKHAARNGNGHAPIVRAEWLPAADDSEPARLRREIAILKEEIDVLTKTVMIFARRPPT